MRKLVVNSSPLIALSGIYKLNIFRELYGEIYITSKYNRNLKAIHKKVASKPYIHFERFSGYMPKNGRGKCFLAVNVIKYYGKEGEANDGRTRKQAISRFGVLPLF